MAPAYYIVVHESSGSGAVLTRDFNGKTSFERMSDWFMVQTNDDREIRNGTRRAASEQKFKSLPRNVQTHQLVFDTIMSQSPNFMISRGKSDPSIITTRTISTSIYDPLDQRYRLYAWRLKRSISESVIMR